MDAKLPLEISKKLVSMPEAGMGWQVIRVRTKKEEVFDDVVVIQCELISSVAGKKEIPFDPEDIVSFELTNDRRPKDPYR
jgi:hypothetical protein